MKSGMTLQNLAVEIDRVRRTKCDYLIAVIFADDADVSGCVRKRPDVVVRCA